MAKKYHHENRDLNLKQAESKVIHFKNLALVIIICYIKLVITSLIVELLTL